MGKQTHKQPQHILNFLSSICRNQLQYFWVLTTIQSRQFHLIPITIFETTTRLKMWFFRSFPKLLVQAFYSLQLQTPCKTLFDLDFPRWCLEQFLPSLNHDFFCNIYLEQFGFLVQHSILRIQYKTVPVENELIRRYDKLIPPKSESWFTTWLS